MSPSVRTRYLNDSIRTAPPARLLTMLYDALLADLGKAESALASRDLFTTNTHLVRAQDIVLELSSTLRLDLWPPARELRRIYTYVHSLLVAANIEKDLKKVKDAINLLKPLQEAWHEAAASVLSGDHLAANTSS